MMISGRLIAPALACATLLSVAAPVRSQDPPRLTFHDQLSVEWVSVPVVVKSRKQSEDVWIDGLEAKAFSLYVDGRAVPIEDFTPGSSAPLGLVFLQDLSGSMALAGKLALARRGMRCILDRLDPSDVASLVSFAGDKVRSHVPFTTDRALLAAVAEEGSGYGTTAMHDALTALPEIARDSGTVRRAAVLLTDGADNSSRIAPEEARALLAGAGLPVSVFDVGPLSSNQYRAPRIDSSSEELSLSALAAATGGLHLEISTPADAARACRLVTAELRNQYLLGFTTDPYTRAAYHDIEVAVRGKRRRIRYRSSYYGALPRSLSESRTRGGTVDKESR